MAEIESGGGVAFPCHVDVAEPEQNEAMVATVLQYADKLDIVHLNAGIPTQNAAAISAMSIEEWDRVMAINLRGVFLGLRFCSPAMARSGGGAIVLMSSLSGLLATPGTCAYMAAKHAVIGLARAAAVDLAPVSIRVNAICPGMIDTDLFTARFGSGPDRRHLMNQRFGPVIPGGRVGAPDDVARLIGFLVSDDASYITGGSYMIDGGVSIVSALSSSGAT